MTETASNTFGMHWYVIPEFPDYEVTTLGIIRNRYTRILMPLGVDPVFGSTVTLWDDSLRGRTRFVSALVESATNPDTPDLEGAIFPEDRVALIEALCDEASKLGIDRSLWAKTAEAMTARAIREGWHPHD